MAYTIPKRVLFEEWLVSNQNDKEKNIFLKIKSILNLDEDICSETESHLIDQSHLFCIKMKDLWQKSHRTRSQLEKNHSQWLSGSITVDITEVNQGLSLSHVEERNLVGRPRKSFEDSSLKTKKRRVEPLLKNYTVEELRFATEHCMDSSNEKFSSEKKCLSTKQALALFYDIDLSVRKYNTLRSVVNALHPDCFPSYRALLQTKKKYLPNNITVTEISAEVGLQELLQKTTDSILNISNLNICQVFNLKLICKWGFDGSSGHSLYKQKFESASNTDEYMFLTALVPIKLVDSCNNVIWSNPKTNSTFYCRPIKFAFIKENPEVVRQEENAMVMSVNELKVYTTSIENKDLSISYEMILTMFDGSIANILSETNSCSKCIICGATPKEMNSDTVLDKSPVTQNYRFGISTLHCWIRFFECLLHIAYRLPIKTWQVKGAENKAITENTKRTIQENFKSKMGLIVDKPKPGYGSTNDGNTARRFFQNPVLSSQITGIDKELIEKFHLILRILASGCNIDITNFRILLNDTRRLYLHLYSWYYMPRSVHKVLVHGCDIIDFFELPIGQLAEDALEARHRIQKNQIM
ncbi:uncharacterized protein LOC126744581 isoform X1 [Anthonomus grandis grandis]|uniref:uncharacterized protein LOC126744581 isoform X1 n=1 Tax=Anthonomus grandis grandis TaxID=2921223 RepID=UPI002165E958|nr:uncharacterized protein LOC126744581 isoform X1 [Anthonomus grandis grandis]